MVCGDGNIVITRSRIEFDLHFQCELWLCSMRSNRMQANYSSRGQSCLGFSAWHRRSASVTPPHGGVSTRTVIEKLHRSPSLKLNQFRCLRQHWPWCRVRVEPAHMMTTFHHSIMMDTNAFYIASRLPLRSALDEARLMGLSSHRATVN